MTSFAATRWLLSLLSPLHGTWLGGFLGHSILIPLWTLSPIPALAAIIMLFTPGWTLYGIALLAAFMALMVIPFPYSPAVVKTFYDLDLTRYYRKCELRGPHLDKMTHDKTLYLFHPHGILASGFVVNGVWSKHFNTLTAAKDLNTPQNTGTIFLIARNLREWAPLFKVLCDLSGRLESATKSNINRLMSRGRNLAIIPGGFEDATIHCYGRDRTFLKNRKGLVKYALQHGYKLTPVYSFGESETYYTFTALLKQRLLLNQYSIPGVLFFGWWLVPLFPRIQSEILTYIGAPIQLPHIPEPTAAQVDEWHEKYMAALTELFNKHKTEAGRPDAELEIF